MLEPIRTPLEHCHGETSGPDVVWLSVSASLHPLDRPLLRGLSQSNKVRSWQFELDPDEPNCFSIALEMLHDYLSQLDRPVHAIGHGMGGVLGLVYARLYPQQLRSLSLLSVAPQPAADWQAHYYTRLQLLPCSRHFVLAQMVRELFGRQSQATTRVLIDLLQQDLDESLSPHSLVEVGHVAPGGCNVPMFVASSEDDTLLPRETSQRWLRWLKSSDRLWQCPSGRHFFHRFHPQLLAAELMSFWETTDDLKQPASLTSLAIAPSS